MSSRRCRLYDENLLHNIMLATGLSVFEFIRENRNADSDEVCYFVEENAEAIIGDTISHLKEVAGSEATDLPEGGIEAEGLDSDGDESEDWQPPGP